MDVNFWSKCNEYEYEKNIFLLFFEMNLMLYVVEFVIYYDYYIFVISLLMLNNLMIL